MSRRTVERKQARQRLRQRGRSASSFLLLTHDILRSPEFGALSPWALKLLIELAAAYNGINNGDLSAAFSDMCKRGWNSPGTLSSALKELRSKGWLTVTRQGGRNRCSLYSITWWPIDHCSGKLECSAETTASHEWNKSKPVVISRSS